MIKRVFPPLFVIGAVLTLLGFSAWQLQRLEWKEGLIAAYAAAAKAEPVAIETLGALTKERHNYARVTVTGVYLPQHELDMGGRRLFGQTGYHVLTPLQTAGGEVFLINRGWVPSEMKDPAKRRETLPEGEVTVSGMIRFPEPPGVFTPANHPEKNFWFTVDVPAMEKATGLKLVPLTVEIIDRQASKTNFPVPADGKVVMRNDHLGYAITWFCLAIAAGVIGWLRLRE